MDLEEIQISMTKNVFLTQNAGKIKTFSRHDTRLQQLLKYLCVE